MAYYIIGLGATVAIINKILKITDIKESNVGFLTKYQHKSVVHMYTGKLMLPYYSTYLHFGSCGAWTQHEQ